jgi:methylthioribose-1-phosphate isomerase
MNKSFTAISKQLNSLIKAYDDAHASARATLEAELASVRQIIAAEAIETAEPPEKIYTVKEIAAKRGVTVWNILTHIRAGNLATTKLGGRYGNGLHVIREEEAERFIAKYEKKDRAKAQAKATAQMTFQSV